ncbi:glycosyltransferase family 39 protein [Galbibacter sp. EGI 63066]|uniref:ArnT family glycosyltransferase n=1 Tax=Galbibacter sp. EGI 63066 TaxID=2993559 RepID=UPI0022492C99|nr:glycosyltransferase family 39 protein [Galbibacter sp. EGI 63066]MCX2680279.1 glycosyltransferase family 39 protein [Galbibacter sp. EGI 63066]
MTDLIEKYPVKVILLVCLCIFFTHLDVIYVNIMEARNFVTAREMLSNGNWILTTMNDYPRYEKPPLPTWLTAISSALFGIHSLFALRLPAALSSVVLVFFVYRIGNLLFNNKKLNLYAALILPTSFYIIFSGRNGQWDIFTHAFMVVSIFFLIKMMKENTKTGLNALLSGLFFGFAFLSKGPVSLYALWLPFLIAYGITYKEQLKRNKILPFVSMLVIGLSIGLSWFVYVRYADPQAFIEIAKEEASNWSSYNVRPFYYYWSFFTQSGIWTIPAFVALLYPYLKNKVSDKKAYTFTFLWTIASVVLLSLIPEKKSRYLLPVLIPMAMNTAFYVEYLILHFKGIKNKGERFPVYLYFGLIACIGIAFPIGGFLFLKDKLSGFYLYFVLSGLFLFVIGILMFYFLRKKEIKPLFYLTITFIIVVMAVGFPLAKSFNSNTGFNNISKLKTKLSLYSLGEPSPEMIWHYGKSAPEIQHGEKLKIPQEKEFGLLVSTEKLDELQSLFPPSYRIEFQEVFDINYTASPEERAHKQRLTSHFYIIKKEN